MSAQNRGAKDRSKLTGYRQTENVISIYLFIYLIKPARLPKVCHCDPEQSEGKAITNTYGDLVFLFFTL